MIPGMKSEMTKIFIQIALQTNRYFVVNMITVKPNAVKELTILDQDLTNIEVQWQPPVTDRKLMYMVSWRSQWDDDRAWQVTLFFVVFLHVNGLWVVVWPD